MTERADESRFPEDEYPYDDEVMRRDFERGLYEAADRENRYVLVGDDVPDYGGAYDPASGTVHSDADPGL